MIDLTGINADEFYRELREAEILLERDRRIEAQRFREMKSRQAKANFIGSIQQDVGFRVLDGNQAGASDDSPCVIEKVQLFRLDSNFERDRLPGMIKLNCLVDRALDDGSDVITYFLVIIDGGKGSATIDIHRNDPVCEQLKRAMYENLVAQITLRKPKNG